MLSTPKLNGLTSDPLIVYKKDGSYFIMYYHLNGSFYAYPDIKGSMRLEMKDVYRWVHLDTMALEWIEYEKLKDS